MSDWAFRSLSELRSGKRVWDSWKLSPICPLSWRFSHLWVCPAHCPLAGQVFGKWAHLHSGCQLDHQRQGPFLQHMRAEPYRRIPRTQTIAYYNFRFLSGTLSKHFRSSSKQEHFRFDMRRRSSSCLGPGVGEHWYILIICCGNDQAYVSELRVNGISCSS